MLRFSVALCALSVCAFLVACNPPPPVAPPTPEAKPAVKGAKPAAKPATAVAKPVREPAKPVEIQKATVSLEQIRREAAEVEVLGMKPVSLVVGSGKTAWARVPQDLLRYQTKVFASEVRSEAVADYKVTKGGYLVVACNYSYQGNDSGNWVEERWTREQFYANGWRELVAEDIGGPLVDGQNRQHVLFVKGVATGQSGRLRCNKYSPPYFIICSDKEAVTQTAQQ